MYKLILGDAFKKIKKIPDESIDLILTDPPYGIEYKSWTGASVRNDDNLNYLPFIIKHFYRVLKKNRHIYIFTRWDTYPEWFREVSKWFKVTNMLVWVKNNWSTGDLEAAYAYQHELIIYAQKGRRKLRGEHRDTDCILGFKRVPNRNRNHPTEKPVPLLKYLIEKSTDEGEIVFDPFMGSGSTGVAAIETKRKFIGIEIDEKYYNIARSRLVTQKRLFEF